MAKRTYSDAELAAFELARRSVNKHVKRNGGGDRVDHWDEPLRGMGTAELVEAAKPLLSNLA